LRESISLGKSRTNSRHEDKQTVS